VNAPAVAVLTAEQLDELATNAARKALDEHEPAAPMPERPMDRAAAAAWFSCSLRTVDGWLSQGCPAIRLGGKGGSPRMLASELTTWLRQRSET
jgi:hypothetical protein